MWTCFGLYCTSKPLLRTTLQSFYHWNHGPNWVGYCNTAAGPRDTESGERWGEKGERQVKKLRGEGNKKGGGRAKNRGRVKVREELREWKAENKGQEWNSGGEKRYMAIRESR